MLRKRGSNSVIHSCPNKPLPRSHVLGSSSPIHRHFVFCRLNETISRLGSQQQDKLEKWRENAVQISEWLDKAQLRLAERGTIGSDLKIVTAQRDDFQVCISHLLFNINLVSYFH